MKKMLICCATLCVTLTLFCVAALATELQVKVEPVNAETVNVVEKQGGADRVFTVTKNSGVKAGDLYLVLIQKGVTATEKPKPTAENIYYIDVVPGEDSGLNKEVTPRDMDAGSYGVFLSDWSDSGKGVAKGVATITLSAPTSDPGDSTTPGGDPGTGTTPGDTTYQYGDVNHSGGKPDNRDIRDLARYVGENPDYIEGGSKAIDVSLADINSSGGKPDNRDVRDLARHVGERAGYLTLPLAPAN